jgi:hypothetical protein
MYSPRYFQCAFYSVFDDAQRKKEADFMYENAVFVQSVGVDVMKQLEKGLTLELLKALRHEMTITYEWLDVIPPDPNGKLRLIVSEI